MNALEDMTAEWYLFGCALKITPKVLGVIEDRDGLGRYMNAMLEDWLKTSEATWENLQEALINIGNRRLAKGLEKYKQQQEGYYPHSLNLSPSLTSTSIITCTLSFKLMYLLIV